MKLNDFYKLFATHPKLRDVEKYLSINKHIAIKGLCASSRALTVIDILHSSNKNILVLADDADSAGYFYFDLLQIIGGENLSFFPSWYKYIHKSGATIAENEILRTDSLNKIIRKFPSIIVTYPEALIEKVVSKESFDDSNIVVNKGDTLDMSLFVEELRNQGFYEVDFVYEVGQFSQRGSIIDIFSYSSNQPYRIDFFGNNVDSIRTFDIEKQLSLNNLDSFSIVGNRDLLGKDKISLLEFVPDDTLVFVNDIEYYKNRIEQIYYEAVMKSAENSNNRDLSSILIDDNNFISQISDLQTIELSKNYFKSDSIIEFATSYQPEFNKNFNLISECLKSYISNGYSVFISSDSKKQTDRIASIFEDRQDDISFTAIDKTLHEGFIDNDMKICLFTDHQIFNRFHKFSLTTDSVRRGKATMLLKELNQMQIGDLIVHHDHGIGEFAGLIKTDVNGKLQEVIKIIYRGGDIIFVNISSLHKISKYRGKDGSKPSLSKLGTGAWERLKNRTKSKVKDIARDLIKIYASRLQQKGFACEKDSYLQDELEASFLYEDTPDQLKATNDIKMDMESTKPMDRLVCGDVGFGKTEVAMRAAFKAVCNGKQVAVLVPTTILAFQHYQSFVERFKDFPVKIEYLSRAKTAKQTKEIVDRLINGQIDILIGTHKIVGKSIKFKDLGLLVIDEEQKFGVAIKEKLKQLKSNVDTLTLTATPIPRTLQFSLMGARDLSIINTPPPNRYPVITELIRYDEQIIKEAIEFEMNRNGQIFFVNNKIHALSILEKKLKKIVPEARIAVAHGQMVSSDLENIILDFIDYEYDILLATTVIESGIDIPNVNTIFINNAHSFGLSDLHQLRGRVGRSNRKAYCYMISPDFKDISDDARRRLQALTNFSDLGSGFYIAMQDLDIRGAGNMLGAEQSGFIAELGYETYQKILNEAVYELQQEEFQDIISDNNKRISFVDDCNFESDLDLLLPSDYVSSTSERISLYSELNAIQDNKELDAFRARLIDRFGKMPQEAEDLINVMPIRWIAAKLGVERLFIKNGKMKLYLVSNPKSLYYNSEEFGKLLKYATQYPQNCRMGETNSKRYLTIEPVNSIETVLRVFDKIDNM